MTTQEVATKLVQLCRENKNMEAIQELYAEKILSLEPEGSGMERTEGKEAIIAKNNHWFEAVEEFHGATISEPIVAGNHFACTMDMDVTYKGKGRSMMSELCVYEVKDGSIVAEEFFYSLD